MPASKFSSINFDGDTPSIFKAGPTGNPVMGDPTNAIRLLTVQATAVATQDIAVPLPLGARLVSCTAIQQVAPTGATASMQIGSTVGAADITTATDVKTTTTPILQFAVGGAQPLLPANFASIVATSAGGSIVNLRLTQTTPTVVGTWLVTLEWVMA